MSCPLAYGDKRVPMKGCQRGTVIRTKLDTEIPRHRGGGLVLLSPRLRVSDVRHLRATLKFVFAHVQCHGRGRH
jgi:hypothetical protein